MEDLLKIIYREWATVTAHPQGFLATLAAGLLVGWGAAWIILRQRLIHHREMLDHYKEALTKKGPKPKIVPATSPLPLFSRRKMIAGVSVLILVVLLPAYAVLRLSGPSAEVLYRATLQFASLFPWKVPGDISNRFNVQVNNVGNFAALHVVNQISGRIEDHELTPAEVQTELKNLNQAAEDIDKKAQDGGGEVGIGRGAIMTLMGVTATDQEFAKVTTAQKQFYVFWVANYDDEIREGKSYWHVEFCGYFVATMNFWHNCSANRTQLVQTPRYR